MINSIQFQGKIPGGFIEAPVKKADCGTQTETHFIESNMVKTYEWNEWELRRKAIKLVRYFMTIDTSDTLRGDTL